MRPIASTCITSRRPGERSVTKAVESVRQTRTGPGAGAAADTCTTIATVPTRACNMVVQLPYIVLCPVGSPSWYSDLPFPGAGPIWAPSNNPHWEGGMGQGIQQPSVQQDGGNAFLDVFKVLFEP